MSGVYGQEDRSGDLWYTVTLPRGPGVTWTTRPLRSQTYQDEDPGSVRHGDRSRDRWRRRRRHPDPRLGQERRGTWGPETGPEGVGDC